VLSESQHLRHGNQFSMLSAEVWSWDIESLNSKPVEAIIAIKREGGRARENMTDTEVYF